MAININTSAASAFSDLLSLALQMSSQAQDRKWRSMEAEKERLYREAESEKERLFRRAARTEDIEYRETAADLDRQFRESSMYLQNMLTQENQVIESILDAEEDAAQFGIDISEPINRLAEFQKQNSTSGVQDLLNLTEDIKTQRIDSLLSIRRDISQQKGLFSQGERLGDIMDANLDNILTNREIDKFEDMEKTRRNDPDYVLSESFIQGARNRLSDPEAQLTKLQLTGERTRQEYAKTQQEYEKTRQDELKLEMERQKVAFGQTTTKFQLELANMYRDNNISSMSGKMSAADYELSSGIHQYFKGMSKAEIFEMIENSPVTYIDQVPGELDYSDIDAIRPQMRGFISNYLNDRPDVQEFLDISQDDFDAAPGDASDNFNFAIQQGAFNAMSGFEQNPNYEFKTEFITTQAKAAELQVQKAMTEDLRASYAATIPTLQNYFAVDTEGNNPGIQRVVAKLINDKAFVAKAEKEVGGKGRSAVEVYVDSIVVPLTAQADPTTVNLLITQSKDIKKIIDASGLQGMEEVINAAIAAKDVVRSKYAPVKRLSKPERTRRKKLTTSNVKYVTDITEKYGKELSDMKDIGLDLIRRGYDPNSIQYKTVLLQELSLKLLETTDQAKTDSLRREIEFLQKELDKVR